MLSAEIIEARIAVRVAELRYAAAPLKAGLSRTTNAWPGSFPRPTRTAAARVWLGHDKRSGRRRLAPSMRQSRSVA